MESFVISKKNYTFEWLYMYFKVKMADKEIITALEANVRRLMKQHAEVVEQLSQMQQKNQQQAVKIRTLQQEVRSQKDELTQLRLSEAMGGSGDKRVARAQVNRLLREIDKCIALVSAQK